MDSSAVVRSADQVQQTRAFRRLAHKTQVFVDPQNDHVSTRLTHTLEVVAIARRISEGLLVGATDLSLDLDLVEAIALAHDLGHPPFGHAGEAVLARLCADSGLRGFHHAAFGVRILAELEHPPVPFAPALLDGVLAHSKGKTGSVFSRGIALGRRGLEAHIVRAADLYAYACGDLEDAFHLGWLRPSEVPALSARVLGANGADIRSALIRRTVAQSLGVYHLGNAGSRRLEIALDDEGERALLELRGFMYEKLYEGPATAQQTKRAAHTIECLFRAFCARPRELLDAVGRAQTNPTVSHIVDAIACMTDRFALQFAARI